MLVLTRKKSERIIIIAPDGTKIYATVVEFRSGDRVRIGVDAPLDWLIHREEVYDAILRDGAQPQFPKPPKPTADAEIPAAENDPATISPRDGSQPCQHAPKLADEKPPSRSRRFRQTTKYLPDWDPTGCCRSPKPPV